LRFNRKQQQPLKKPMVKNYTTKFISEKLNSQLSFDFNSNSPTKYDDAPSEMCIQSILGFSAAIEVRASETGKDFIILRN
jgi:hypothetical protein